MVGVTTFLQKKIRENGGNPEREALNIIFTRTGKSYYALEDGTYWRMYLFVEGATSYDESNLFFRQGAAAAFHKPFRI